MATRFQHLLPAINRLAGSSTPIALDQVGRDVNLSPTRAQRVFAEEIGESPKQFQLRVRLQRAAALLLGSNARVIDIALASGFASHEAFTRAFNRRFDMSPSQYRAEFANWSGPEPARVAAETAPCVGLHRRPAVNRKPAVNRRSAAQKSLRALQENESAMENTGTEVTRRDLEAIPVLFGTRKLEKEKIADGLAEVLPAAFGYAMGNGLAMAGPPFVRHIEQSPAFVTVEAGVPLAEAAPAPPDDSGLSTGTIPAATVATAVHKGPYETLEETYVVLDRWMHDQGVSPGGPPWEVYLTDPGEVPDPAEWLTEINWPIA